MVREDAANLEVLRDRFVRAQLAGDRRGALRLLVDDGLGGGASVLDMQLRVVQEAQREIGRLWQENRISVAQEHLATAIANMALSHLYDRAQPAPRNGRRVAILPPISSPASECTMETSSISSGVSGGRIDGSRAASIDLPEPGAPTIRRLWPPAAATSSTRLALS